MDFMPKEDKKLVIQSDIDVLSLEFSSFEYGYNKGSGVSLKLKVQQSEKIAGLNVSVEIERKITGFTVKDLKMIEAWARKSASELFRKEKKYRGEDETLQIHEKNNLVYDKDIV